MFRDNKSEIRIRYVYMRLYDINEHIDIRYVCYYVQDFFVDFLLLRSIVRHEREISQQLR